MQTRPLILKAKGRKAPELDPIVRVESVRTQQDDDPLIANLINGTGYRDIDNDGLKEQSTALSTMWLGKWDPAMKVEFDLPESVPLSAISIMNYNGEWSTTNGIKKLDVSVSTDGQNWQTVAKNVEIPEAEGTSDYDEPFVLKLNKQMARKIRFENIVTRGTTNVGLSKVFFHEAVEKRAIATSPEDGATDVGLQKVSAGWTNSLSDVEFHVFLGNSPGTLALLKNTRQHHIVFDDFKPDTTNYWRIDTLLADGTTNTGRIARFETLRTIPVAWWKFDDKEGAVVKDASAHKLDGKIKGTPNWGTGHSGGALEFDGKETVVDCGKSSQFNFGDGLAVSVWIKVKKFDKPWQTIISKGDKSWKLQRNKERGTIAFTLSGVKISDDSWMETPTLDVVSTSSVNDNKWHHIVGTYDGHQAAIYVDGKLQESRGASGSILQNSDPVWIGNNSGASERQFNGWIDDVRIFDHGISQEVINELLKESSH